MEHETKTPSANLDPITGAPGAHPIRVGIGAAAGGMAAGAAAGTLAAGPVGTVVGAAIGAVAGGLGGKAIAERYDPTIEEAHWKKNYEAEPYYQKSMTYDDYALAYKWAPRPLCKKTERLLKMLRIRSRMITTRQEANRGRVSGRTSEAQAKLHGIA